MTFSIINLYNNYKKISAKHLLTLTVLALTLSNLQYWMIDVGLREKYSVPKVYYVQFELLIVPLFFLFIRKYLQNKINIKSTIWLFAPFLFGMVYQVSVYNLKIERTLLRNYNLIVEIITLTFNILLILFSLINILKYQKLNKIKGYKKIGISTQWLINSIFASFILIGLWIITTKLFYSEDKSTDPLKVYYPLWIGISIIIYWIGNKGLIELKIYYDRKKIRQNLEINKLKNVSNIETKGSLLFHQFLNDLEEHKIYLNPNLSLSDLGNKYNVSTGYLSQVINKYSDIGFTDLINKHRIKEAQKMLLNESFNKYTVESIALESGFSTKANFYRVFKKLVGVTPNQYKKVTNL